LRLRAKRASENLPSRFARLRRAHWYALRAVTFPRSPSGSGEKDETGKKVLSGGLSAMDAMQRRRALAVIRRIERALDSGVALFDVEGNRLYDREGGASGLGSGRADYQAAQPRRSYCSMDTALNRPGAAIPLAMFQLNLH
jgi:hypothetical protein